jgi:hypothetical protein
MMYPIVNVLKEASSHDLITLDEMKTALRIPSSDTSKDAELTMIIQSSSLQIAKMCNRVFGYEQVREIFYSGAETHERIYLSRWPVKSGDIISLTQDNISQLPGAWVLEEKSGTLMWPSVGWAGTIDIVYSGGYRLPEGAPDDLKRIAAVAGREDYYTYLRGAIMSGVRMLSHKSARVMFYPPGQVASQGQGGGGAAATPTWNAINSALRPYIRHWV